MDGTDQDLLRDFQDGDRDAFRHLVHRWSPRVLDTAARLLGDRDEARDVRQITFLRLWAGPRGFGGRSRFSTWLHQVVVNLCRDRLRSREARQRAEGAVPPLGEAAGAAEVAERRELVDRVGRAVAALPEAEREVLVLRHYAGLTFARIGEVLDIPATTARSRMGRALDRLRYQLEDRER